MVFPCFAVVRAHTPAPRLTLSHSLHPKLGHDSHSYSGVSGIEWIRIQQVARFLQQLLCRGCACPRVNRALVETRAHGTWKSIEVRFFRYWYLMIRVSWLAPREDLGEPTYTLSFFVGCLNPCLRGTSVRVGSPQPGQSSCQITWTPLCLTFICVELNFHHTLLV